MGLTSASFPPSLFLREGAEVASAREPEEHAALCGHLPPPGPDLRSLDHVSFRFSQLVPACSQLPAQDQAFPSSSEDQGARHPSPHTTCSRETLADPAPVALACCGAGYLEGHA
jgi:hypothetical protein